uniref:Transposase IS66 central domain-containing protein n=1 Tax=mine drainage metagenome TaxID=410659 RepID=E6PIU8_9ZZZZ
MTFLVTILSREIDRFSYVRGRADPGLLTHVLVGKYGDHLPLYRQAEIDARQGLRWTAARCPRNASATLTRC